MADSDRDVENGVRSPLLTENRLASIVSPEINLGDDYVQIKDEPSDPVEDALQRCYKQVIKPIDLFLCLLGWRAFVYSERRPRLSTFIDFVHTVFVLLLLIFMYVFMLSSVVLLDNDASLTEYFVEITFSLAMWSYGVYYFRRDDGRAFQDLCGLIEKAFLRSSNSVSADKLSQEALARNLINYIRGGMGLLVLIVAGVIWIAVTMSLELSEELGLSTGVYAVAITFVGFGYLAEYAAYMATLIIYFIIIRLQVRLIDDMRDRLTRRSTDLPALERDLAQLSKAVSETNRGWAMPMSALAFSQLVRGIMAHSVLIEPHASLLAKWQAATAGAICFFFFMSCVYPPSLLSWKAERLRQTSWRVRGERSYRNATIQDIDSYMNFVHATSLRGKLLGLPVVHQFVFVILFVMSTGVLMMWGAGWYASGESTGP